MDITYNLYVEKLEPSPEYITLKDKEAKIYLTDFDDNELLAPTKVSDLDNYLIYKKTNKHNETNEEIIDKYKLRIWVDGSVTGEGWTEETKLEYKFKIGVSTEVKEITKLDTSGANEPVLSSDMVPVYYDGTTDVWRKADSENINARYKWYNYDEKMWANAVTYDHTKVLDLSSSSSDGKIEGATYTSSGIKLDGENDYIDTGNANYDFGNKITVAARVKFNDILSTAYNIIGNAESSGFGFSKNGNNQFSIGIYSSSKSTYEYVLSHTKAELNKWYTVVATYDSSNIKLYVDGVLEKTVPFTDLIKVSTQPIFIGANPNASGLHNQFFDGTISDALVINDVLTEEEIETYYSDKINYQENENTLFYYNMRGYEGRVNGTVIPMEMINTMLVWIPRYKYTVWNYNLDGTVTSQPQEIQIDFEEGTRSSGEISCEDNIQGTSNGTASGTEPTTSETCKIKTTQSECTDSSCNGKTYTHPAFTFGDKELTGFWVGKFEASSDTNCTPTESSAIGSGCNLTSIKPLVKPNVTSWRGAMVGTFENNMMAMNDSENKYGFATTDDTHMMKNMEWGAVAYLSHSKYGINKEIALNSNSSYTTGCGPQTEGSTSSGSTCNAYNTTLGQSSSTTGNIYGIYDMSGGGYEYVMGNTVSPDGETMMSGNRGSNNNYSGYTEVVYYGSSSGDYTSYTGYYGNYPDDKYYDKYSFNTSDTTRGRSKLGDAIKEVYNTSDYGWYSDNSLLANSIYPWLGRGGIYTFGSNAGVFLSNNYYGYANRSYSSRLVISQP